MADTVDKITWSKAGFPGITCYKHPTRKHGIKFDTYFRGQYQVGGKRRTIGFGWSREGWSAKKAHDKIVEYKNNAKQGARPTTLAEERELENTKYEAEVKEKKRLERENITFDKFFTDSYLAAPGDKKESSITKEKSLYNNWIKPVIGEILIKEIKAADIEKIQGRMRKAKKSARTQEYALSVVRQVFNRAINHDVYEDRNPVSRITMPKVNNGRKRFLSDAEANELLKMLASENMDLHDSALLSWHCGLRAGEIFNLKAKDINFETGKIHLRDTKDAKRGSKSRTAYMTDAVREMLEKRVRGKSVSDWVFPNRTGGKRNAIQKQFWDILEKSGLNDGVTDLKDRIVFHSFRHSYASKLVDKDVDFYVVQTLLGHSTPAMTQRYAHLRDGKLQDTATLFNEKKEDAPKQRRLKVVKG